MEDPLALLVHDQGESMVALKLALEGQSIQTCQVRSCQAASDWPNRDNPPQLVFTDEMLPDGIWSDIVTTASVHEPVDVIVVAPSLDVRFHAEAIQCGALDCDGRHHGV
jgi:DNA-binding NtrC family response regulator